MKESLQNHFIYFIIIYVGFDENHAPRDIKIQLFSINDQKRINYASILN